jgi:hypothetical protein
VQRSAQAEEEVSVMNLGRRKSKTVAAKVCRVGRIQHLGSVVCFSQGVRASPSERIRVGKLKRYRTFEKSSKESTRICAVKCFRQELQVHALEGKL